MSIQRSQLIREDCLKILKNQSLRGALNDLRDRVIVITGGTGMVGSWLLEMITCLNDEWFFDINTVVVARNMERFKKVMPHLSNRSDVHLIKADVRTLLEVPEETDYVIHAAATPDGRFHATDPVNVMRTISEGTANMLEICKNCSRLKLFVNLSSGLVNGTGNFMNTRISETYQGHVSISQVSSAYAEAKRYGEVLGHAARTEDRLPTVNVRPFAFIGPYQSLEAPWALNNFLRDGLSNHPIRILGDGQSVRSYLYGADSAYILLKLLNSEVVGKTFNLGSSEAIYLHALAELISTHLPHSPEVILQTNLMYKNVRTTFVPDTNLMEQQLQYKPLFTLNESIARTVRWHQAN